MTLISRVFLSRHLEKELDKLPYHVLKKFRAWTLLVELVGLRETRLIKSYHDEPLCGKRVGQRSIRLNRSYRAIYLESYDHNLEIVEVIEVNKHDY